MKVKKIVIHQLLKEVNERNASTDLSRSLLEINGESTDLVEKLNQSYSSDSLIYAVFDETQGKTFPESFSDYINTRSDNSYLAFSNNTLNNLRDQIRNINLAKGGYFVYSEYEINGIEYCGVFLIRNAKGVLFKKSSANQTYEINSIDYLNTDRLAMACRINYKKFLDQDGKYLTFIKHRLPDISEYFINWIAAYNAESNAEYTKTLYDILNRLDKFPLNEEGEEKSIDEFRKDVYDIVRSSPGKIVNLKNLGSHFYDDENYFTDFIEANQIEIDTEFRADSRALKGFIRIEVNADGIHLRFTRGELNSKVKIDPKNDNLIIIESKKFADKFRRELDVTE